MKNNTDLIILTFHINVTGLEFNAINEIVRLTDEHLTSVFKDVNSGGYNIKHFVIPSNIAKIDCVYPHFLTDEKSKQKQDDLINKLTNMVDLINKNYQIRLTDNIDSSNTGSSNTGLIQE